MGVCVVTVDCAAKAPILQSSTALSVWMNCGTARSQTANSTRAPCPIEPCLPLGAGLSANFLLLFCPDEKVLLVHPSRHRDVEKSHHHFVVGLLAPAYLCICIRIVGVCFRIVVPRDRLKFRARP